jgi:hypothetical protein
MKEKKLTFVMTFGHCGIDWMHSLLDSHPQILIMPALSFYRCWKMLNAGSIKNVQEMYNLWHKYINNFVGPEIKNEQKKFLNSPQEMERFFLKFHELLETSDIEKTNVFLAIHEAYAFAKQMDLEKKTVVVSQEHLPWPFEDIITDFPQAEILMIVRDPRASIAGLFHGRAKHFGHLPDYTFNMTMECWFQGQDMWRKYRDLLGPRYKIIKNEDLHDDLETNMRAIAKWLDIDFSEKMLYSTFPSGKPCLPDSLYREEGKPLIQYEDIFYLPENVRKRWMEVLKDPKEILMIEVLLKDIFKEFGYKRMTKDTYLSRIQGLVFYLLPHRGLVKRWLSQYPDVDEFDRIEERLQGTKFKIIPKIWEMLPKPLKFVSVISHSVFLRINIYFFPGERWKRYDLPIKL